MQNNRREEKSYSKSLILTELYKPFACVCVVLIYRFPKRKKKCCTFSLLEYVPLRKGKSKKAGIGKGYISPPLKHAIVPYEYF